MSLPRAPRGRGPGPRAASGPSRSPARRAGLRPWPSLAPFDGGGGQSRKRRGTFPYAASKPALAVTISRRTLVDISLTAPLLSSVMSVIAQAIADRQREIDRLQAEIKALTDVEEILGASAPPSSRPTSPRSSSTTKPAAPASESRSDAKPARKRRPMTAAEKKAVSERMTAYWAQRRKQAAKKKRSAKK